MRRDHVVDDKRGDNGDDLLKKERSVFLAGDEPQRERRIQDHRYNQGDAVATQQRRSCALVEARPHPLGEEETFTILQRQPPKPAQHHQPHGALRGGHKNNKGFHHFPPLVRKRSSSVTRRMMRMVDMPESTSCVRALRKGLRSSSSLCSEIVRDDTTAPEPCRTVIKPSLCSCR